MDNPTYVIRPHAARPPLPGRQSAQQFQPQPGYRSPRLAPPMPGAAGPRRPVPPARSHLSNPAGRPSPVHRPVGRPAAGLLRSTPSNPAAVPSKPERTSPTTAERAHAEEAPAQRSTCRRKRSVAWVYYTILATLCLIGSINAADARLLLPTMLCAAYATYLYRGGRFVFWIW
jgi:hypothetical protein